MDPAAHTATYSALEVVADATALVDNHAHPFWVPPADPAPGRPFAVPPLSHLMSEAHPLDHPAPPHDARATLAFARSLRDMHALLIAPAATSRRSSSSLSSPTSPDRDPDADPDAHAAHAAPHALDAPSPAEHAVEACRLALGPWDLARRCFSAAGVAAVLIDDGLPVPPEARAVALADFPTRLGVPIARRVLRLEVEAARLLHALVAENRGGVWRRRPPAPSDSPDKRPRTTLRAQLFRDAVHAALSPPPPHVVAFKSIAAYRSGLAVRLDWTDLDLEEALDSLSHASYDGLVDANAHPPRLEHRVLVDCVVREGLRAARTHSVPVQFHCGFGDTDVHLPEANPVHLRDALRQFPDVAIVLLHGAWPYTREAAYLASVFPRVYVDVGLAIPLLSVRGMLRVVEMALEVAPITRVLYSSDAHSAPDVFYLAARWGRRAVATALAAAVCAGDLDQSEAKAAVRKILAENAARLYNLPVTQ